MLYSCSIGNLCKLPSNVLSILRESIDRYVRNWPRRRPIISLFSSTTIIFSVVNRHRLRKTKGSIAARERRSSR
jgi:hypothetical protein